MSKVKELLRQQEQRDEEQEVPPIPAQPPKAEVRTGVIQEPTFVEETYDFDEDSEEVDLAVESEILDEEAEWEEAEEGQEILPSEEYEEEVAEEFKGKVKFVKMNVLSSHENNNLAAENGVMGTPTLIFYCEGRPVGTAVGFQPKERLKQLVDDMLEKNKQCLDQSTKLKN